MKNYSSYSRLHHIPQYIIPPFGWRNLVSQAGRIIGEVGVTRPNAAKLKKAKRLLRIARHYRPRHSIPKTTHDPAAVNEFLLQSLEQRRAAKAKLLAQQTAD